MKIPALTAIKYILFLVVGLGIIYYLFSLYYNPSFLNDLKSVSLKWLTVSALCAICANVFRAFRWQLMITPLTNKKPAFLNVFNALMVGYLVNLALPRAGELARCAWLAKKEQMDTAKLIGSVIAERIFDLLMLLVLVLLSLLLYQDLFAKLLHFDASRLSKRNFLIVSAAAALGFAVLVFLIHLIKNNQHPVITKVKTILKKLWDGFISVRKMKNRLGFIIFTLFIWFFYIASSYFAFKMLQQTELLTYADALLTVVAASFGMIAPIQGGIGAFHFMVSKCLVLLDISSTPALVYATVLHASQTLLVILLGTLAFVSDFNFAPKADSLKK